MWTWYTCENRLCDYTQIQLPIDISITVTRFDTKHSEVISAGHVLINVINSSYLFIFRRQPNKSDDLHRRKRRRNRKTGTICCTCSHSISFSMYSSLRPRNQTNLVCDYNSIHSTIFHEYLKSFNSRILTNRVLTRNDVDGSDASVQWISVVCTSARAPRLPHQQVVYRPVDAQSMFTAEIKHQSDIWIQSGEEGQISCSHRSRTKHIFTPDQTMQPTLLRGLYFP